jgi:hypothetical protein
MSQKEKSPKQVIRSSSVTSTNSRSLSVSLSVASTNSPQIYESIQAKVKTLRDRYKIQIPKEYLKHKAAPPQTEIVEVKDDDNDKDLEAGILCQIYFRI